eukprot:325675-Alexandrium_andersonii.AAC.1
MSASLVGSEMCIRDRSLALETPCLARRLQGQGQNHGVADFLGVRAWNRAVSYTHLTLPTICSV